MPIRSVLTGTGGGVDGVTGATTVETFALAGTEQVGDVLLFVNAASAGSTPTSSITTPAAGATTLSGPDGGAVAGGVLKSYVFMKLLNASDISGGVIEATWSSSRINVAAAVVLYGVDSTNVQVATPILSTTATSVASPTVTTPGANADVLTIACVQNTLSTPPTVTQPGTYTTDKTAQTGSGAATSFAVSVAHLTTPGAAGTYGGDTVTLGNTPAHSLVYTLAIGQLAAAQTMTFVKTVTIG